MPRTSYRRTCTHRRARKQTQHKHTHAHAHVHAHAHAHAHTHTHTHTSEYVACTSSLQPLDELTQLEIAGNQLKCSCSTNRFQEWLRDSYVVLTRPETCTTTDGASLDIQYDDLSFLCDENGRDVTFPTVAVTTPTTLPTTTTTITTTTTTTVTPPTTTTTTPEGLSPYARRYDSCGARNSDVSVKLLSSSDTTTSVGWDAYGLPRDALIVVTCSGFGDQVRRHMTSPIPVRVKQATVQNLQESTTYMACVTVVGCPRLRSCRHITTRRRVPVSTRRRVPVSTSGPVADATIASWSNTHLIGVALALAALLLVAFAVTCVLFARRRHQRRHKRPVTVITNGGTCGGAASRMRMNSLQRAVQHGVIVGDNQYESIPVGDGRSMQRLHKFAPFDNTGYVGRCSCGMSAKYGVPCDCATTSNGLTDGDDGGYLEPVSLPCCASGPRRFTKPGCEDSAVTDALMRPNQAALQAQLAHTIGGVEIRGANQLHNEGPSRYYKNVSPQPPQLPPRDVSLSCASTELSPHLYAAVDHSARS